MAASKAKPTSVDNEILADLDAVIERVAIGKRVDPELSRRIRERAEQITDEIRRRHGELDIAVELIRETREQA